MRERAFLEISGLREGQGIWGRTSRLQSSRVSNLSFPSGQNSSNTGLIVSASPSNLVSSLLSLITPDSPAPVPVPVPAPEVRVPEDTEDAEEVGGTEIETVEELESGAEVREALDKGRGKARPKRRVW